ncbi:MAG: PASTA domain-containing protein [Elusimicrobia bacterium]|nr:PASTA domain-containing protein [Elusimicrobiota bacterium]
MNHVKKHAKTAEIVAVALVLAALGYYSLNWAVSVLVHGRKEQVVPDITKKSSMAALDMLAAQNLGLRKDGEEFDGTVPVGSVIRQIPPPGTVVREGKVIRAWFSQGGETVFCPNLVGLSLRNAELALRQTQLILGEVGEAYSMYVDKNFVISQDPKAEVSLTKNAMINVMVSGGPPPSGITLMPSFRQKNIDEAMQWAAGKNISVIVNEDTGSTFPNGKILGQDPEPDTVLSDDAKVFVTVSRRRDSGQTAERVHRIHYELSQGGSQSQLRITLIDQNGEREIFNGIRPPGSKIDLTSPYGGPARIRIFVNGILVEERSMP